MRKTRQHLVWSVIAGVAVIAPVIRSQAEPPAPPPCPAPVTPALLIGGSFVPGMAAYTGTPSSTCFSLGVDARASDPSTHTQLVKSGDWVSFYNFDSHRETITDSACVADASKQCLFDLAVDPVSADLGPYMNGSQVLKFDGRFVAGTTYQFQSRADPTLRGSFVITR